MKAFSTLLARRRGFTLLDTLVALAIFGGSVLIAMGVLVMSVKEVHARREAVFIGQALESNLEQVRNLSWTELVAQPAYQTFQPSAVALGLFGKTANSAQAGESSSQMPLRNATAYVRISADPQGNSSVKQVEIGISYTPYLTRSAIQRHVVTLISKEGISKR